MSPTEVMQMSVNHLVVTVEATHRALEQRLDHATRAASRSRPRDVYSRADAFLSSTSRHVAAAEEVLVPVARRRLSDGDDRVRDYLHRARRLEQEVAFLKARLYGQASAVQVPWARVWRDVSAALGEHNRLESALAEDLAAALDDAERQALAEELYRAEVKAPTRAHPYLPHTGTAGRVSHRVWAVADRFWDAVEGRIVPQLVRPPSKAHSHDSLMAQYLVGEPLLDDKAPVLAPRHPRGERRRRRRGRSPEPAGS